MRDLYLLSAYPGSGSSDLLNLLSRVAAGLKDSGEAGHTDELICDFDNLASAHGQDVAEVALEAASEHRRFFLKTHLPPVKLSTRYPAITEALTATITIVRDPIQVMASVILHETGEHSRGQDISAVVARVKGDPRFHELVDRYLEVAGWPPFVEEFGDWGGNVSAWSRPSPLGRPHWVVECDALAKAPTRVIGGLTRALGWPVDEKQIMTAVGEVGGTAARVGLERIFTAAEKRRAQQLFAPEQLRLADAGAGAGWWAPRMATRKGAAPEGRNESGARAQVSSAQNFEDVLLDRLFGDLTDGFYVDIGAADPEQYSVTKMFYDRGWRGVNVEPHPDKYKQLVGARDRDINISVGVGGKEGDLVFFECVEHSDMSTFNPEVAADLISLGFDLKRSFVRVSTLNQIFEKYCPRIVDFLKIDVEGLEADIINAFDFKLYRPRVLVIESTRPNAYGWSWDRLDESGPEEAWEPTVLGAGYVFAQFDGLNRFYLRREDAHLAKRLQLPPGVLDEPIRTSQAVANVYRKAAEERRAAIEDYAARLTQTTALLETSRAGMSNMDERLRVASDAAAERLKLLNEYAQTITELRQAGTALQERIIHEQNGRIAATEQLAEEARIRSQDVTARSSTHEQQIVALVHAQAAEASLREQLRIVDARLSEQQAAFERVRLDSRTESEALNAEVGRAEEARAKAEEALSILVSQRNAHDEDVEALQMRLDETLEQAGAYEAALKAAQAAIEEQQAKAESAYADLAEELTQTQRRELETQNAVEDLSSRLDETLALVERQEAALKAMETAAKDQTTEADTLRETLAGDLAGARALEEEGRRALEEFKARLDATIALAEDQEVALRTMEQAASEQRAAADALHDQLTGELARARHEEQENRTALEALKEHLDRALKQEREMLEGERAAHSRSIEAFEGQMAEAAALAEQRLAALDDVKAMREREVFDLESQLNQVLDQAGRLEATANEERATAEVLESRLTEEIARARTLAEDRGGRIFELEADRQALVLDQQRLRGEFAQASHQAASLGQSVELAQRQIESLSEGLKTTGRELARVRRLEIGHLHEIERVATQMWLARQRASDLESLDTERRFLGFRSRLNRWLRGPGTRLWLSLAYQSRHPPAEEPLPRITVVTPVFNGADTISDTVNSILSQGYPNLEYIVMDGGSTDGTLDILRRYNGAFLLYSEPDEGMYDAIAKGFERATGDIFCYLNSDDIFEPGALHRVAKAFGKLNGPQVVYFEDDVHVYGWKFPNIYQPKIDFISLLFGHIVSQDGVFFTRRAYNFVGGLNRSMRFAGDWDLWVRLSYRFRFKREAGHISTFRVRPGQLSGNMEVYEAEREAERQLRLAAIPRYEWWSRRVEHGLNHFINLMDRLTVKRARKTFYPMDFQEMPPPEGTGPPAAPVVARSPLSSSEPHALLFSKSNPRRNANAPIDWIYDHPDTNWVALYPGPSVHHLASDRAVQIAPGAALEAPPHPVGGSPYRNWGGREKGRTGKMYAPGGRFLRRFAGPDREAEARKAVVLRALRREKMRPGAVLDVGCEAGLILDSLKVAGWETFGCEPAVVAATEAASKGHRIETCSPDDLTSTFAGERRFDLIIIGDIADLAKDPLRFLARFGPMLSNRGRIILTAANLDSAQRFHFGPTWSRWHGSLARHYYGCAGARRLAQAANLKVRQLRTYSTLSHTWLSEIVRFHGFGLVVPAGRHDPPPGSMAAAELAGFCRVFHDPFGRGDNLCMVLSKDFTA